MIVRRRVVVDGRVQGVFFRDSCRRVAEDVGVSGWIRNLWDGRVEAVFEGDELAVAKAVDWCRAGPPRATITAVEVHDEDPSGDRGFLVR